MATPALYTNQRALHQPIRREMPSAKFIHMVRDPIATLTSRRQMEPSVSLRNALQFLKTSFSIAAEQENLQQYLVIRYEDLCNAPAVKAKEIANFLGIGVWETLTRPSVAGEASQANSSFNRQSQPGIILKPDQHQQRSNLTENEQRLIAAVMGKVAERFGYELTNVSAVSRLMLKLRYRVR